MGRTLQILQHFCSSHNACLHAFLVYFLIVSIVVAYYVIFYAILIFFPNFPMCQDGCVVCPWPAVLPIGTFVALIIFTAILIIIGIILFVFTCIYQPCKEECARARQEVDFV